MPRRQLFDRFVNFSDAVVAIALTLLVLPLVDVAGEVDHASWSELLHDHGDKLFAFVLSFVVVAQFWMAHTGLMRSINAASRALVWANFVWLLSIVFLPVPTSVIASAGMDHAGAAGLYIGTMVVTTATGLLMQWIIIRSPQLQDEEVRGTLTLHGGLVMAGAMLLAFVLAIAVPAVGLWSLMLLVPTGAVTAWLDQRGQAGGRV